MEIKEISKGIFAVDLALYLAKSKTLVIADTHVGYEEALNKQGYLVPRFQFKELGKKLEKIIRTLKAQGMQIDQVVINGDIKHEFGRISEQEWRHTLQLIDFLVRNCKEIVLVRGNHDTILGPIADKRSIKIKDYFFAGDILIMHGDKLPGKELEKQISTIVIAHEHPAISLGSMARFEKYKCFLVGEWKKKTLVVQPSFNLVTEGTDVLKESLLSPFLKKANLKDFEVVVVGEDEKFYDFGKMRNIK